MKFYLKSGQFGSLQSLLPIPSLAALKMGKDPQPHSFFTSSAHKSRIQTPFEVFPTEVTSCTFFLN